MIKEEKDKKNSVLEPQELEAVYSISRAVIKTDNVEKALDEVIRIARPVFIFDNVVFYEQKEGQNLEVVHVRAIGRGRFREADLAWGESIGMEAFTTKKIKISN